ncbi:helix-turn-helix domain-containing protein, partial [Nocardioides sp.]
MTRVSALAVRVLGELTVDGTDLTSLDRKARALLLLLALARGRPVSTDALADALWGDGPPARPSDQVAVLASRLRRVLGREHIPRSDAGYRLRADWLDLAELEAMVNEIEDRPGAAEARVLAGAALALIRGPIAEVRGTATWA